MGGSPDSMLPHLAGAARAARRRERCRQIEVAYRLGVTEDTISQFERGLVWPRNPDATVQAYADELGLEPIDLWMEALKRWSDAASPSASG